MRLLLIEDDKTTIKILQKQIENLGLKFDYAETGYESINYYRSKRYEIIVIDLKFPGKDVFEILIELNLVAPNAKLIIYTSKLDNETSELLKEYNIHDVIIKESGHKKLLKLIESLILETSYTNKPPLL